MTPRRVAVIGAGRWANEAHLPALAGRADVVVTALVGHSPERLAQTAARFGIARTYTDPAIMLAEARPEVVIVLTPNHTHAPLTLAALEAGAHVICEKPLALSTAEAEAMLARAEALGRRHSTFFTYRGMAGPRYVHRLVTEGYLGRLHHCQVTYLHESWLNPQRPASWKTRLAEAGTGVLGDLGAHVIDLLQWWFGPMRRVAGSLQTMIPARPGPGGAPQPVETDDAAAFTAEFAAGGQATVQLSRVAPGRHNYQRFELYGERGVLVYEYDEPLAYVGRVSGAPAFQGAPAPLPIPADLAAGLHGHEAFPALFRALTDPFFASLAGAGPSPAPSFVEGVAAQRVIDAVARSAASGRWETVPTP